MYKIGFLVSLIVLSLCLVSCQQKVDRKVDTEPSDTKPLDTKAQAIEEDFVYRLVTEKAEYGKNEPIKIYAELEYTGEKDDIEIFHSASPFSFPMVETTRNFEIGYGMDTPLLSTKLRKGEPLRAEYWGSGGYTSEDKKEYVDFISQIMNQEFPEGRYIVNGSADFYVKANEKTEQKKNYNLKLQVEFKVNNTN
ncbi:hypothetical protein [Psychrobacillus sp. MER TA 171]|uniref:hypothetical protein n=1 Tax=Psychrobacillus sp. MER TA 171 TaxID=2939577 RepID=UPI002040C856|nr:hypothetical protein [Psychrobacillus sp. MER TA 171]MCM3356844.1 hypothetical protein [Psychrobacillus sp. MER TA 171]